MYFEIPWFRLSCLTLGVWPLKCWLFVLFYWVIQWNAFVENSHFAELFTLFLSNFFWFVWQLTLYCLPHYILSTQWNKLIRFIWFKRVSYLVKLFFKWRHKLRKFFLKRFRIFMMMKCRLSILFQHGETPLATSGQQIYHLRNLFSSSVEPRISPFPRKNDIFQSIYLKGTCLNYINFWQH